MNENENIDNCEIKFKAWDKDMKMIIYPKKYYAPDYEDGTTAELYNPEENEFHTVYDIDDRFELMQFIGLKDKNGIDIYNHDICMLNNDSELIGEVIFIKGCFALKVKNDITFFNNLKMSQIRIIGNKFEKLDILQNLNTKN